MFYNVHETYDFETAAPKNVEARDRDQFDPVNKTMSTKYQRDERGNCEIVYTHL